MNIHRLCVTSLAVLLVLGNPLALAEPAPLDAATIERLTGAKGKLDEVENVFKVSLPRSDLRVTVAGVNMSPPMGLTSWAAFKPVGDQAMVMGDMVLLEGQINPVMDAALDNGIEVTALHNHFLWDKPKLMFMHIAGSGDVERLAAGIGKVFAKIQETSGKPDRAAFALGKPSLEPNAIAEILAVPVEKAGEAYKVTIGRTTQMGGHEVGKTMGVNTWAVFAGSDQKAIVEGDFAVLESELQGVLKSLRGSGISITTIHNHMVGESPRILFLHYWGTGSVKELAAAIKAALAIAKPAREG